MNTINSANTQVQTLNFSASLLSEAHRIRVAPHKGNPWFLLKDIGPALGLKQHPHGGYHHHLSGFDKTEITHSSELGVTLPGSGMHRAVLISESGLYKLIMRSDKPEAKPFQDWVTKVVLPAIRKDGAYIMGEEKVASGEMSEDELVLKADSSIAVRHRAVSVAGNWLSCRLLLDDNRLYRRIGV